MLNKSQVHQEMVFIVPRWYDMEHSQEKILIKRKLWESTNISGLEAKVAPAKVNDIFFDSALLIVMGRDYGGIEEIRKLNLEVGPEYCSERSFGDIFTKSLFEFRERWLKPDCHRWNYL